MTTKKEPDWQGFYHGPAHIEMGPPRRVCKAQIIIHKTCCNCSHWKDIGEEWGVCEILESSGVETTKTNYGDTCDLGKWVEKCKRIIRLKNENK